jgi:hypothetical protein
MSLVEDMFERVKFDSLDINLHNSAYDAVKEIANIMDVAAPNCAEKTLALRALHLALMHFGTALSKHEKYKSGAGYSIPLDEMPSHRA